MTTTTCINCKKIFDCKPVRLERTKYCSRVCLKQMTITKRMRQCIVCNNQFYGGHPPRQTCSKKCLGDFRFNIASKYKLWENNPMKRREVGISIKYTHGYKLLWIPDHPIANRDGYVLEHRKVMSDYLKRILAPDEEVHHINKVKTDNRIENLELTSKKDHAAYNVHVECPNCHSKFNAQKYHI